MFGKINSLKVEDKVGRQIRRKERFINGLAKEIKRNSETWENGK